jgi:hypothetical protein
MSVKQFLQKLLVSIIHSYRKQGRAWSNLTIVDAYFAFLLWQTLYTIPYL